MEVRVLSAAPPSNGETHPCPSSQTSPVPWSPATRASSPPTRARARSRSASRASIVALDGGEPPRLPRAAVHHAGRRAVHQRRDPLRRDDPPEGERRHAVPGPARGAGHPPGHQGRQGHQAAGPSRSEKVTEGLDGLRERIAEYRGLGARFAKWRAVIDDRRRHPERHLHRRPTPTRSRATRRSASRAGWCRSSSPRC